MGDHTPGPWRPEHFPDGPWWNIRAGEDTDIASTSENWDDETVAQAKANARLIAAAPELLTALEAIMDEARYTMKHEEPGADLRGYLQTLRGHATSAIAKARGLFSDG